MSYGGIPRYYEYKSQGIAMYGIPTRPGTMPRLGADLLPRKALSRSPPFAPVSLNLNNRPLMITSLGYLPVLSADAFWAGDKWAAVLGYELEFAVATSHLNDKRDLNNTRPHTIRNMYAREIHNSSKDLFHLARFPSGSINKCSLLLLLHKSSRSLKDFRSVKLAT